MAKPQRLLHDDPDYYIAIDLNTNTYYICYRTLLMIDIDFYKDSDKVTTDDPNYNTIVQIRQEAIIDKLEDYALLNDLTFKIYRSRNGLHAFLVSRPANYKRTSDLKIMLDHGCDFFLYRIFLS